MNKYLLITLISLVVIVIAFPAYAILEPTRMQSAQADLQQDFVFNAAAMYVENCAVCHGAEGEGVGATPALNTDGLREMDYDTLFKTIARGRYDTMMAPWHIDEGGIFNDYQIDELVALIRYVDWAEVSELSAQRGLIPPTLPVPVISESFLELVTALDPQGSVWAEGMSLYGENCTVCHGVNGEGSSLAVPLNTPEIWATESADLVRIIREGVPGTMMPAWDSAIDGEGIDALVEFLLNWDVISEAGLQLEPPAPIEIDLNNPEEVLALGESIFNSTCIACHGEDGSGGTGPALNSQQILTNRTDAQIESTIVSGGRRPNSSMPAFGDRLTSVEIEALVQHIRSWEPTAPWVENPRGTEQGGGGPPWLRSDSTGNTTNPGGNGQGQGSGGGQGQGNGQGQGGGPWWRQENATPPPGHQTEQTQ